MKVTLTRNYKCAPEGHTTLSFSKGDTVDGKAAEMALADKAAKKDTPKRNPKPAEAKTPAPDHEG